MDNHDDLTVAKPMADKELECGLLINGKVVVGREWTRIGCRRSIVPQHPGNQGHDSRWDVLKDGIGPSDFHATCKRID